MISWTIVITCPNCNRTAWYDQGDGIPPNYWADPRDTPASAVICPHCALTMDLPGIPGDFLDRFKAVGFDESRYSDA